MAGGAQPTTTVQSSQSSPWKPAQPALKDLLAKYGALGTDVTGGQQSALDMISGAAGAIPSFAPDATQSISNLFRSNTDPQMGMLSTALDSLNTNIGGTASGAELNPYDTPGFGDALNTMGEDITNRVKGVYAGSGRDPSGAGSFAGSLGRGLTAGLAPVLQNQFNTNKQNQMSAADSLFRGAGTTAGALTQQAQVPLANALQGLQGIGALTNAFTAPGAAQLAAANQAYQSPFGNLAQMLNPITQIAGLGGQTSGTSTTTPPGSSGFSNVLGGIAGVGSLLPMMFSDERVKDDKAEVGVLYDGQKVWSYKYKGDDVPRIGLMAQEVETRHPEAVAEIGGVKAVDYGKATADARAIGAGMLSGALNDNHEFRKAA